MQFNGAFGGAEAGPGKDGQAQVDGGGIEGVDGVVEFQSQVFVGIQGSGECDEGLGEVGVDAPVAVWLALARVLRETALRKPR